MAQLEHNDESLRSYQAKPTGFLRISTMMTFGEQILIPFLNEFKPLFPEIILDVSFSDELSNLSWDDVDIAIRGGFAPNERIQAVRLMDNEFIPVASPDYLSSNGIPENATDLRQHQRLFFCTPNGTSPWLFEQDGQWLDVSGKVLSISNNVTWLRKKIASGRGICMAPRWSVQHYLNRGDIKELFVVPKVKVAVDFLSSALN